MQDSAFTAGQFDDDKDDSESPSGGTSEEQGYEGAGVEEGGGYQRSGEGGGYEESATEGGDYDPRREAEGGG